MDAFDQDSARVINAALEGSIPDHVLNPDPSQSFNGGFREELDAMRAAEQLKIPKLKTDQVWQGKRDDVNAIPELGKRLKQVTIRSAVSIWEDVDDEDRAICSHPEDLVNTRPMNTMDAYEDEYDDTYEVHEGAVDDVGSSAESDTARLSDHESDPIQAQQKWNKYQNKAESHTQGRPDSARNTVLRIENPEVVRERQQTQRAFRRGRFNPHPMQSGPSNSHAPAPRPDQLSSRASTANPEPISQPDRETDSTSKQPGNSHSVAADRAYKSSHKARFANHNRRRLADKKRQF
ncbi:unnamed protein product [Echinostoma caproni]|uniref:Uncharacterized protein n=1 Tax=Echinostoma caproni TaxID=27848 RepID=A0A3P8L0F9_9TREM|nr:unnamed protein product [Echinostoma caproni]